MAGRGARGRPEPRGSDDATDGDGDSTPTLAPTPTPEPGSSEPPAADLRVVLLPDADLGVLPRRLRVRDPRRCRIDYQRPGGETIDLALLKDPADDPGQRVGSLIVNPGGPGAPGTSYAENAVVRLPRRAPRRLRHRRLRPARHRRVRPGRLPLRRRSSTRSSRPTPTRTRRRRAHEFAAVHEGFYQGCMRELRQPDRPRHHRRGGPRHGRAAGGAGRDAAALLRRVLRHQARARRTPTCSPTRSAGWCSTGPSTSSLDARELSLEQAGGFEVALRVLRPELRRRGRLLPRRQRRGRAGDDPAPDRRASTTSRCRPRCDRDLGGGQRLLRPGRAALQPRLLADPRPGAGAGARRRRDPAAAAL